MKASTTTAKTQLHSINATLFKQPPPYAGKPKNNNRRKSEATERAQKR